MKFRIKVFILFLLLSNMANAHGASINIGGVRITKDIKSLKEIKNRHIIHQSLDFSCGAAGLSTLLNYYLGDPVSEQEIISTLLETVPMQKVQERRGFSLLDIKKYAELKGYKATGYRMDIEFLRELGKPALVPIKFRNYRHFVIAKEIIGDRIFIADPAAGNVSMKVNKFEKIWTDGIGLVVEHTENDNITNYALQVDTQDIRIADHRTMERIMNGALLRTTIFINEY